MKSFASSVVIRGTLDATWQVLTGAPAYPSWNSTVTRVDGTVALGGTATVHGKVAAKGGRVFELRPSAEASVAFTMREDYSGLLAPLISKSIPDPQPASDEFATCLKARVEGS